MTRARRSTTLIAALALLAGLAVATPAQAAPVRISVMTFNICGSVCRNGEVTRTARNVVYQVAERRVGVTFLQEVCYSQYVAVRDQLARRGYRGVFAASTRAGRCDNHDRRHGTGFGNAILVRGKVSGRTVRRLPSPAPIQPEPRTLLGTTAQVNGRWFAVFTTHTAPSGPNLTAQLAAVRRVLEPVAHRRPVLLGGDLNAMPDHPGLDDFYSATVPDGRGMFREMDETSRRPSCRCGAPTFRPKARKIDYVFGSARHFDPRAGATVTSGYSDHRMYVGEFLLG